MSKIQTLLSKIGTNKIVLGFVAVLAVAIMTASSVVSAAPDYFDIPKLSATSQCYGSTTVYRWEWKWQRHHWHHITFWTGHWVRVAHKTPNWEKIGFDSRGHCVRYTGTAAPKSKEECKQRWYRLGFENSRQCARYFKLHGNTGYGG